MFKRRKTKLTGSRRRFPPSTEQSSCRSQAKQTHCSTNLQNACGNIKKKKKGGSIHKSATLWKNRANPCRLNLKWLGFMLVHMLVFPPLSISIYLSLSRSPAQVCRSCCNPGTLPQSLLHRHSGYLRQRYSGTLQHIPLWPWLSVLRRGDVWVGC